MEIESLFVDTARTAFGSGDGILRIEWSRADAAPPELLAVPRALGKGSRSWIAAVSNTTHPGPGQRRNTKHVDVPAYDLAREEVKESNLDEVLLVDANGMLVEGGRSNFIVVTDAGRLWTPNPSLGAVEGLGLAIVLENRPEIGFDTLSVDTIASARELISVNVVRGIVPIVELDGRPVADGEPGPWALRLRNLFHSS